MIEKHDMPYAEMNRSDNKKSKQVYYNLDLLRGVAAIVVALFHFSALTHSAPLFPGSYLAVDFFFLMSGFVLVYAYDKRLSQSRSTFDFLVTRFRRLFPLYLLGTIIGVVAISMKGSMSTGFIVALPFALTMLPFPPVGLGHVLYPYNGPAWSLFYELTINSSLPKIVKHKNLSFVLLALGILGLLVSAFTIESFDRGFSWPGCFVALSRVAFSFSAGILIYRFRDRLPKFKIHPVALCAILLAILSIGPRTSRNYIDLAIITIAFPSLLSLSLIESSGEMWRKISEYSGSISYPLYAVHQPIFVLASAIGLLQGRNLIAVVCITICIASIAYSLFDAPLQRLLRRHRIGQ